jgi:hypothetical protein
MTTRDKPANAASENVVLVLDNFISPIVARRLANPAQRRRPRDASIATATARRRSLQREAV